MILEKSQLSYQITVKNNLLSNEEVILKLQYNEFNDLKIIEGY